MNGYSHPAYAESLGEFADRTLRLEEAGASLLIRKVSGAASTRAIDAMAPYPLFSCSDWAALPREFLRLEALASFEKPVSVSGVIDPFGNHTPEILQAAFPDRLIPFKNHFVADLEKDDPEKIPTKHHRYYTRQALATLETEARPASECSPEMIQEWIRLYSNLTRLHSLQGIKAFSRKSFTDLFRVPGLWMLSAREVGIRNQGENEEKIVGAHLWFLENDLAISHLAATDEIGYEKGAAYALYWEALRFFKGKARFLNFGAGAGLSSDSKDGLTQFKKGWANDSRTAFFGGRILDRDAYRSITSQLGIDPGTRYFPAYRNGELA